MRLKNIYTIPANELQQMALSLFLGYPRYQQPPITTVGSGIPNSNFSVNRSSVLTGKFHSNPLE